MMNMVRSMLAGKKVPKVFWPEAVKWATYVMNRSPTLSVKNMTPQEAWSGKKPNVQHFRVFGCLAFVHVPDSQRIKLDNKSIKCIHLGEKKGWDWNKSEIKRNGEFIDEFEEEINEPVNEPDDNVEDGGSDSDASYPSNPIQTPSDSENEVDMQASTSL
ncbi:copia-type polyprotein, partial [Trifolium pratense]